MRSAIVAAAGLIAGCGGGGTTSSTTTVVLTNQGMTTTAVTGSTDCATKPDFVPIYPGSTIVHCSSAHFDSIHADKGSVLSRTDAAPATVLAWVKEATAKAGLKPGISTDTMVSAVDGTARTTMTHAEADPAGGTRVVTNWGKTG